MLPDWQDQVPKYFISIGSNVEPHTNMVQILQHLLNLSSILHISRILKTAPVKVEDEASFFLNGVVCLYSSWPELRLKQAFNRIETALGRDRNDPSRQYKSRPADIDILFRLDAGETAVSPQLIPPEFYVRPMLIELLTALNLPCGHSSPLLADGVALPWQNHSIGHTACTLKENTFHD